MKRLLKFCTEHMNVCPLNTCLFILSTISSTNKSSPTKHIVYISVNIFNQIATTHATTHDNNTLLHHSSSSIKKKIKNKQLNDKSPKSSPKPRAIVTKNHSKSMSHDSAPLAKRSRHTMNERNFDNDNDLSFSNATPRRNDAAKQLLNRPVLVDRAETEEINVQKLSDTLKQKKITPSTLSFGFLGLGIMGSGIVKNLINSGHKVAIWNRTGEKCRKFEEVGATVYLTPSDVIDNVDITFSCVSDPTVAKQVGFGQFLPHKTYFFAQFLTEYLPCLN